MRRPTVSILVLTTFALIAGCLDPDVPPTGPGATGPTYEYFLGDDFPIDLDHDHSDPGEHVANFQIDFVAHHACTADGTYGPTTVGGFTDIAFWHQYAFVGKRNGFCILDVTDPTRPEFVSSYLGEAAFDMEVSPDGNYAFLLTQRNSAPGPLQSGSTDPTDNAPRGAIVVDVTDKENPEFESYYPVPTNGVHTAAVYDMDGRTIVSIQTYDWLPPALPLPVNPVPQQNPPVTQRIELTELQETPAGTMNLVRIGQFSQARPPQDPLALWFPHDVVIQKHPVTGQHLLYAAYWDAGLIILDISDPTQPLLVGRYNDPAPSKYNAYHDVKVSEELIDGRHITVAGPELESAAGESGVFRIFDTTDPSNPVQLSAWGLPGVEGFSGGYQFSPHVFQVIEGRIYLAHNHGGIWVLDIHNETLLKEPKAAGYYFPHGDEEKPETWARAASVWGAYVHNGYVYATETTQGVHVLHWVADNTTQPMMDESMPHEH